MNEYERRLVMDVSYPDAVALVRQALAEQGFGALTEIDVRATLREKLGLEMEDGHGQPVRCQVK